MVSEYGRGQGEREQGQPRRCIRSRVGFVMLGEERDGLALLSSTACPTNTVDIVLDGERELWIMSVSQVLRTERPL